MSSIANWSSTGGIGARRGADPSTAAPIGRDGNPDGALHGEAFVFRGALQGLRRQAADVAATTGCPVAGGVNKHTTVLVVGDYGITKVAGQQKSTRHLKADALTTAGQAIHIIRESRCLALVATMK